jgi:hypothetical protein
MCALRRRLSPPRHRGASFFKKTVASVPFATVQGVCPFAVKRVALRELPAGHVESNENGRSFPVRPDRSRAADPAA